MSIWRLLRKEIFHRWLNFALGVIAIGIAVGAIVVAVMVLRAHDVATEQLLTKMQTDAEAHLTAMKDDYRKYMKELGFNLLVLPDQQDLTEFWTKGYASYTMPEEHVGTLANSRTMNMRHLLPIIQQQVLWPEQKRSVILIGTRGEVPLAHRKPKEPLLVAVPEGKIVLGHRLASDLELDVGDTVTLLGEQFEVVKTHPERGTAEDITVWIHLAAAQRLLDMPGRINGIEALKCFCVGVGVEEIRKEVAGILEGTNVILRQNKVTVRAKARTRAEEEYERALSTEQNRRAALRNRRESIAAMLVPLVVVASTFWIGLLAIGNVRERVAEIGILRALGVGSRRVFLLFQSRAVLIGLIGAIVGCVVGLAAGGAMARSMETAAGTAGSLVLLPPWLLVVLIAAAPLLACGASWIPSLMAARQDPAVVLAHE